MKATLLAAILPFACLLSGCDQKTEAQQATEKANAEKDSSAGFVVDSNGDKWDFYRDARNEWRWRKRSGHNSDIIGASTEGYHNLNDCVSNAERNGYEPPSVVSPPPSPQATPTP